jgi:hypothetical protein
MKKIILLLSLVLLSGCAFLEEKPPVEKIVYLTNPLQLPTRPTLPTLKGADVSCLAPEVKKTLQERDRLRREYAEELEAIIKTTQVK